MTQLQKFATPTVWRTVEWVLALAWPIVAYNVVFKRYGWSSDYYNKWGEIWFALVLLVPMVGPVLVKLFSSNVVEVRRRFALVGLILLGVALAAKFRPHFGGMSFMGFIVPMALHALAVFLWLRWRNEKSTGAEPAAMKA
jgi:hypothetical protein